MYIYLPFFSHTIKAFSLRIYLLIGTQCSFLHLPYPKWIICDVRLWFLKVEQENKTITKSSTTSQGGVIGLGFTLILETAKKHIKYMKQGFSRHWILGNEWWWFLRNRKQVSKPYHCSTCPNVLPGVFPGWSSGTEKLGRVSCVSDLRR